MENAPVMMVLHKSVKWKIVFSTFCLLFSFGVKAIFVSFFPLCCALHAHTHTGIYSYYGTYHKYTYRDCMPNNPTFYS